MRDKSVLIGRRTSDNMRVVIKASNSIGGTREITNEKKAQDTLSKAIFSRESILFPEELYYGQNGEYLLHITKFIEQEKVFGVYPLETRFFLIIREFEAQEGFYANTFEHINIIKDVFKITHAKDYIDNFRNFKTKSDKAKNLLLENEELIETRSNYLTHTDFVPSNFRINNDKIFLIDLSSMHFANRYEGLARLLNYCVIHDPQLGNSITEYMRSNRDPEESLCLKLMRIYKAGLLINYYNNILKKTDKNLEILTKIRLELWQNILKDLIDDKVTDQSLIEAYKTKRDKLRSPEEFSRQKEFNLI